MVWKPSVSRCGLGGITNETDDFALLAAVLLAAPALAQDAAPPIRHGESRRRKRRHAWTSGGRSATSTIKPDGTFSGFDGMFAGTYKTNGNKLCITVEAFGMVDQCTEYPDGKKSGDTFEIPSDMGPMKVTIR